MADSLSTALATDLIDYLAEGTQFPEPPTLHVSVLDDTNTDRAADFANAPAAVPEGDWSTLGTTFTNSAIVDLGEATADVSGIEDIVIYDGPDPATDTELLRTPADDTPITVSTGVKLVFTPNEIDYDAIESTA